MDLNIHSFFVTHTRKMVDYDEFTSLLDPGQKKSHSRVLKNSKFIFLKTLTPFMFLQASVGICASLQVKYTIIITDGFSCKHVLGHILPS